MTDDGRMTQAPTLVRLGGRDYQYSPLEDRDLVEMDDWVRATFLRAVRQSLIGLSSEDYERDMGIAMRYAGTMSWLHGEGAELAKSIDGLAHMAWLALRRHQPELTHDMCRELILDPVNLAELNDAFTRVNAGYESAKKGISKTAKKRKRKSRKRRRGKRSTRR